MSGRPGFLGIPSSLIALNCLDLSVSYAIIQFFAIISYPYACLVAVLGSLTVIVLLLLVRLGGSSYQKPEQT